MRTDTIYVVEYVTPDDGESHLVTMHLIAEDAHKEKEGWTTKNAGARGFYRVSRYVRTTP